MIIIHSTLIDLCGKRFGKWTVIKRSENRNGRLQWVCKCDCGTERVVDGSSLKRGRSASCGCAIRDERKVKKNVVKNNKIYNPHPAEPPYDKYYLYKIHSNKENRDYAVLNPIDKQSGLKRTTVSYARYLMSVKLGRFLRKEETVDHIDNDKTNDDIDNLQILSLADNNRKEANRIGVTYLRYICPECGKECEKRKNKMFYNGKAHVFCSVRCGRMHNLKHGPLLNSESYIIDCYKKHDIHAIN